MNPFPVNIGSHTATSKGALRDLFVEHARGGPLRRQDEDATPVWREAMLSPPLEAIAVSLAPMLPAELSRRISYE